MIFVNFKTYESASGDGAVALAKIHAQIASELGVKIAVAVSALDLAQVAAAVSIPVFAQHVDAADFGSSTGAIVPAACQKAGAAGTLLNHSEKRLGESLSASFAAAQTAGLQTIVCAETADEAEKIAAELQPDFIAVEPPELIGGGVSITTANPKIITESVRRVGSTKLLVGAGVQNGNDVATALKLGAVGVLLASAVAAASDPEAVLRDLASGLK